VHRVAGAVERVLFSPRPQAEPGLADAVHTVRSALRASATWPTRLRALVAPRSAVRAVWDLMDRWTTAKESWATRWSTLLQRAPWPHRG